MRQEVRYKLALASASVLLSLLVAEGLARVILPELQHVRVRIQGYNPLVSVPRHSVANHPGQSSIYVHTPTGGRLRPNTHVTIENHLLSGRKVEISTNSLGYRNREIGQKRGIRILFLGDSITFGDYLPEADTFVRLVQERARSDGHAWETINAGVGAIGLENELAILKETGISIEPDVVVVCWYLNDFHESPGVRIRPLPYPLDGSRLASHTWWTYNRVKASVSRRSGTIAGRSDFEAELASRHRGHEGLRQFYDQVLAAFHDWGGAWSPHIWPHMSSWFEQMKRLADENGFQLRVVAFPVRAQVEAAFVEDDPQRRLTELTGALGVPFLDLLPALREAHASSRPLFYDHCHQTPEGSRVVARSIYDFLLNPDGE